MTRTPRTQDSQIAFNSARFLTSAATLDQCPADLGAEIAFAGRSNAGKSSALNTLTGHGRLAKTSKTPGRTRLINFFTLSTPGCRLVDLPGYGFARVSRAEQEQWQRELDAYLNYRQSLKGLTLLMDCRHPLKPFDQMLTDWCESRQLPLLVVLTKADKLKAGPLNRQVKWVKDQLAGHSAVKAVEVFSALKGTGVDRLRRHLEDWLLEPAETVAP